MGVTVIPLFRWKKRFCKCGVDQGVNADGQHDRGAWLFAGEAHTRISNSDARQEGRQGTGQWGGMGGCGAGVAMNATDPACGQGAQR